VLGGEAAGEPREGHGLIRLNVTCRRDRVGHPPRHPREGTRPMAELFGRILIEGAALRVSLE